MMRSAPEPVSGGDSAPSERPGHGPPDDPLADAIEVLAGRSALEIQSRGYHFQPRDFYSALNDIEFLQANRDLWQGRPLSAGIEWELPAQLTLFERLAGYAAELSDVPFDPAPGVPLEFHWNNDFWRSTDAIVQYGLLRHLEPGRIVEIGCGWSSLLMKRALAQNATACAVHQIEPYPRQELMSVLPHEWTRETAILQRASPAAIEALGAGDILFYDGSHVSRAASDVNWFFFEVLPRLAPGVVIHVHDVFLPDDYPEAWIAERGQTWNEQYLLQAFLMYNREFRPLLANAALLKAHTGEVLRAVHAAGDTFVGGGSLWFRRRDPATG